MRLQGKTALVTAAGQGIGRATALAMAAEGAQVWATDVNPALLASYEGVANVRALPLDVLDRAAIGKVVAAMPAVDVLFNCAGFVHSGTVLQASDEEWNFALNLNVRSQFWTIQAVLPRMLDAGRGSIVNMASVCSSIKGLPNRFIYGMTKAAVLGLTKSVAADFVADGIRCNAICPGTVRSPSWEARVEELGRTVGGTDKALEIFVSRQPMGRVGEASEIAALAVYLAADESAFTTGTAVQIDGGWTL